MLYIYVMNWANDTMLHWYLYCLNNWNVWHLPELINYWLACLLIDQKLCTHKTSNVMSGMATSYSIHPPEFH